MLPRPPQATVLRRDFGPTSDVDVLVEFEPGHTPGFAFFTIQEQLSHVIGRAVELHTPGFLSPYFRDQVRAEAEVLYASPSLTVGLVSISTPKSIPPQI